MSWILACLSFPRNCGKKVDSASPLCAVRNDGDTNIAAIRHEEVGGVVNGHCTACGITGIGATALPPRSFRAGRQSRLDPESIYLRAITPRQKSDYRIAPVRCPERRRTEHRYCAPSGSMVTAGDSAWRVPNAWTSPVPLTITLTSLTTAVGGCRRPGPGCRGRRIPARRPGARRARSGWRGRRPCAPVRPGSARSLRPRPWSWWPRSVR